MAHPLFTFFMALALPWISSAEVIQGRLVHQGSSYQVKGDDNQIWPIIPRRASLQQDLNEMETGDFLQAKIDPAFSKPKYFFLSEIHFVGLKRLLGLWVTDDGSVVNIANFSDWIVYPNRPGPKVAAMEKFNYTLAPDSGPGWSILLVHNQDATTGRLSFHGREVFVEVWDGKWPKLELHLRPLL